MGNEDDAETNCRAVFSELISWMLNNSCFQYYTLIDLVDYAPDDANPPYIVLSLIFFVAYISASAGTAEINLLDSVKTFILDPAPYNYMEHT